MPPVAFSFPPPEYLLYLDESGNEDNPADRHFVLGGAAVFERQAFYLARDLDEVQTRHFPGLPPIEFHASAIRSSEGFWRRVPAPTKRQVLVDLSSTLAATHDPGVVLFAAVVEKSDQLHGEKAVERATEETCRRFDILLMRRHHEFNDPLSGVLVFSEGRFDKRAKVWVRRFRQLGTQWGALRNLADIPYFASTKETRLLQAADLVAHAVFLLYERRDPSMIAPFINRFERKAGTLHGLVHVRSYAATGPCDCPACASRAAPGNNGPSIPWQTGAQSCFG